MAEKLNHDPELCEKLIPKWEIGCRRVTPGPGYLESFSKPNCSLTNSPITKITEKGVVTADGQEYECDVCKCINAQYQLYSSRKLIFLRSDLCDRLRCF